MSDTALARLRDPDAGHLRRLAELASTELLAQPLADVLDADFVAAQAAAVMIALDGPTAHEAMRRRVREALERHAENQGTLRAEVPEAAIEPLKKLLGRPISASESLTYRLIDQGVVHNLLAEVLESALQRFMRRARKVDDRLKAVDERLGGFGKRARGLFGNVASELASAVGDELEHSVERRIRDFVHQGTSEMLKVAARRIADPNQAAAWGEFRVAVLDVILDTPIEELAAELQAQQPDEAATEVLATLGAAARAEGFRDEVARAVRRAQEEVGDGTLGAWLDELDLRETWDKATVEPLAEQLARVVASDAFGEWWTQLHAD
ncbi:MAG: hypothetical protein EP330_29985 [Deltaproteobacteria bacterium]|nr:MAG: hypothetical protein EP330_29985 [Deltaproteobacteria bacterium]